MTKFGKLIDFVAESVKSFKAKRREDKLKSWWKFILLFWSMLLSYGHRMTVWKLQERNKFLLLLAIKLPCGLYANILVMVSIATGISIASRFLQSRDVGLMPNQF